MSARAEPLASGRRSLRRRLLFGMGAALIGIVALMAVALWLYARGAANRAYDPLLTGAALAILERAAIGPDGPIVDIPYSALETVGLMREDRVFYRVIGPEGETVTGDPDLPLPGDHAPSPGPVYFDAPHSGEPVRFAIHGRLVASRGGTDWMLVQIGATRRARTALEHELFGSGLAALGSLAALGLMFVWLGVNRALRPLAGIERDLARREPTDLSPLSAEPPREVEGLIAAINGFMRRLKTGQDRAQVFIADVAHQTRTALTALQGQLDLAANSTSPAEMRRRLVKADDQARRTVRLTNQLLSHAMVTHRADNEPLQQIALTPFVRRIAEEAVLSALDSDVEIEFAPEPIPPGADIAQGDPVALREALRNLIDNAIRHGPPDVRIRLGLARVDGPAGARMRLTVEDSGTGIAPERRAEAVERFRSLAPERGGSGLGLAIVKAVAESHGGRFRLDTAPELGGLRASLEIPAGRAVP